MSINVRNSGEKINLEQMLTHHLPLASHSTILTGGTADLAASPVDFEDLRALLFFAKDNNLPVSVLGAGSNSLISDDGIRGLTILTNHLLRRHVQGEMFCVRSGCMLDKAIDQAIEDGLSGLELLGGIPGTIGGAIWGNSGNAEAQISQYLYYVDYMTFDGKLHRMQTHLDDFSYRTSPFKKMNDAIIYEAGFRLFPTTQTSEVRKRKDSAKRLKKQSGHYESPSLGCIFKNPPTIAAGKLIERCNLKGYSIGGAQVSNHHANIIINPRHNATSTEVRNLIEHIKQVVAQETSIILEEEIRYLGQWDR